MFLRPSLHLEKTKLLFSHSWKRFSQQTPNSSFKSPFDQELLYPFSPSQTSKALKILQETTCSDKNKNILLLDKLATTPYSETYRAYNLDNKTFLAQKNLRLDSNASWNQINLILRQRWNQTSPLFAKTLSIEYHEKEQNVKILSELQNTILKDYTSYMKEDQKITWMKEILRPYLLQITQQLSALQKLGIELEGEEIDTQKIFIEKTSQILKLYDLSNFSIPEKIPGQNSNKELLEIARKTLLKVIDSKSRQLEDELQIEYSLLLDEIERLVSEDPFIQMNLVKNKGDLTLDNYNHFIFDKILRALNDKESHQEKGDLVNDIKKVYLNHAQNFKLKGDFKSAVECYEKIFEVEKNGVKWDDSSDYQRVFDPKLKQTPKNIINRIIWNVSIMILEGMFFLFTVMIGVIAVGLIIAGSAWGYYQLFGETVENESNNSEKKPEEKNKQESV